MSYSLNVKKLVADLRGPKGVAALTEEFHKVSAEILRLKDSYKPQAQAQLKKAEAKYNAIVKKMHAAQKDLDKEVTKKVSLVKKEAKVVEKSLVEYKKLALKKTHDLQKRFSKKAAAK